MSFPDMMSAGSCCFLVRYVSVGGVGCSPFLSPCDFLLGERVREEERFLLCCYVFQVVRETARISFVLHTVSDDFWMLLLSCAYVFRFPFLRVLLKEVSPPCRLWHENEIILIFCSQASEPLLWCLSWLYDCLSLGFIWLQTCINYPNAPDLSSCILYRLSKKLSASLSDTKDRTSAHSVSMECMSFFSRNCVSSSMSRMDGDHPSNVKHAQEVLAVCAFSFFNMDLSFEVSLHIFLIPIANLGVESRTPKYGKILQI